MFTLDEKQYDETKMNDKGKVAFVQIQNISNKKNQIALELENLNVLENHYLEIIKQELPSEEKEVEKKTKTKKVN
jgi:hypothetical protein